MVTEGVGFRVPLPAEVSNVQNAERAVPTTGSTSSQDIPPSSPLVIQPDIDVRAIVNGHAVPLPSWIRYIPDQQIFVATAVPDGSLPITLEIRVAGKRTLMMISERAN